MKNEFYRTAWQSIFPKHYKDCGNLPYYDIHARRDIVLLPEYSFVHAQSLEVFDVGRNLYLQAHNINSLAIQGVDAALVSFVPNNYKGRLQVAISSHSKRDIEIKAGEPILRLQLIQCDAPSGACGV